MAVGCTDPHHASLATAVMSAPASRATTKTGYEEAESQAGILFLVDQLCELGGGERIALELLRQLPKYGFRVFIVTFRDRPDPIALQLFEDIRIMPFSSCFSRGAVRVAMNLRDLIRKERICIVHTFFETADIYGAVVARLSGVSCIISSRRDMGILRSRRHRILYRLLGRAYSAVLAVSEEVRIWHLAQDWLCGDRVHTIYNGLAVGAFDVAVDPITVRCKHGIPIDVPLVLTIANINPWKGLDVFLGAAAIVHSLRPETVFAIAGDWTDCELVATLRQLAFDLGIDKQVHFLGQVRDIPTLLLSSDMFVLLSRSEGFPNVVLEAMAARLPVVATVVGGTPEAVEDGMTGFLVKSEDCGAAAAHILRLLSDRPLRIQMGNAGRQTVEDKFSLVQMVKQHVELYNALLH